MRRWISTTKEWLTLRSLHSILLSLQQAVGWHQSWKKTAWKTSWKTDRALCICHDTRKDKAKICPFGDHPWCNMRFEANKAMSTSFCLPGPHIHWPQLIPFFCVNLVLVFFHYLARSFLFVTTLVYFWLVSLYFVDIFASVISVF